MTERYLADVEEQDADFSIGSRSWHFHFYPFRGLMYVDIKRNGEYVLAGKRLMANRWILPNYVAEGYGNLRFETYASDGDDYVWWEGFNVKFRLVSYTDEEIKELEAAASTEE